MSTRAERRAVQTEQRNQKALSQMAAERVCEIVLVRHGETSYNAEERLQGQMLPGPGLTERGRRQARLPCWANAVHLAEALGRHLATQHFDAIYSSDLLRATETAGIIVAARQAAAAAARGAADGNGPAYDGAMNGSTSDAAGAAAAGAEATGAAAAGVGATGLAAAKSASGALDVQLDKDLRERNLGCLQGLTRREAAQLHPEAFASLSATAQDPVEGFPESLESLDLRAEDVLQRLAARHPGQRILVVGHGGFLSVTHMRAAGFHNRQKNVNASINTIRIEVKPGPLPTYRWALVRWGEEGHLAGVGALASAFGGGTEG